MIERKTQNYFFCIKALTAITSSVCKAAGWTVASETEEISLNLP